nr:uncharacterized protein LOC112783548 [Arachis hypogaea]
MLEIGVRYERVGVFCTYCAKLGHESKNCQCFIDDSAQNNIKEDKVGEWLKADQVGRLLTEKRASFNPNQPRDGSIPAQPKKKSPPAWLFDSFSKMSVQDDQKKQNNEKIVANSGSREENEGESENTGTTTDTNSSSNTLLEISYPMNNVQHNNNVISKLKKEKKKPNLKQLARKSVIGFKRRSGGGLAMAWRDGCTVQILQHGRFFIAVSVLTAGSNDPYGVLGVYLSSNDQHRMAQFAELTSVTQQFDGKVVLMGDFNAISSQLEKAGGGAKSPSSIETFNSFIDDNSLIDIGMVGRPFTWSNRQRGDELIQERLDRFLVGVDWQQLYPNATVLRLSELGSNHSPLLLDSNPRTERSKRRFKFQERWCFNDEIRQIVREVWHEQIDGSAMYILAQKLKRCRHKIVRWQQEYRSNSKDIFSSTCHENPEPLFTDFEPKVTAHMNRRLQRPVTMEEVKRATFSIHPQSALGDDGMTAKFFQSFWNILSGDVFRAVKSIFSGAEF